MRFLGRKGFRVKAALLVGLGFAALTTMPAAAATNTVTVGTASLPQFPCANNPCSGGTFTGTVEGKGGGYKFNGGTLSSTFSYTERCNAGDVVPQSGTANGHFNITGAKTRASADFSWVRNGVTANITLTNVSINGGPATGSGSATGIFEPVGKGNCVKKPAAITAAVELIASF
ncbi:MAG: hypothetical protein QOE92_1048 [Chloroflexota bacterium]|jgi:hypothetical protein|nr:hypothetical protein [Chloroflexota bacterium]